MGGAIGQVADASAMQVRLLNTSKGPAVQALRAITDKRIYAEELRLRLDRQSGLTLLLGQVVGLSLAGDGTMGTGTEKGRPGNRFVVQLETGARFTGRTVVVATGVYMEAATVTGETWRSGGPGGEPSSRGLSAALHGLGLRTGRFKTGTSPRVDRNSVDLAALRPEPGLPARLTFSHVPAGRAHPPTDRQAAAGGTGGADSAGRATGCATGNSAIEVCWQTGTTEETHRIILANLHRSPLFSGEITGRGPRHCPSIEDKVVRFRDRPRHPVYLELERLGGDELYVLGMSTSLPAEVQSAMLRSMPGLQRAVITRPGYAIEYDFVQPVQLHPTLETKDLPGLFFAGQVCGTSGYEEAAALGLVAGTNAARRAAGAEPVVWPRAESYIGVLTDDLTTRGVTEPYRIMTARAEHRLHLRHTNADLRLTAWAGQLGLVSEEQAERAAARERRLGALRGLLKETPRSTPSCETTDPPGYADRPGPTHFCGGRR